MIERDDLPYWALIALVIVALFMVAMSKAVRADEAQIRKDCTRDALLHCPRESLRCLRNENEQCRQAVIACMIAHRDKLRPRCAAHID